MCGHNRRLFCAAFFLLLASVFLVAEPSPPSLSKVQDNLTQAMQLLEMAKSISTTQGNQIMTLKTTLAQQASERQIERQAWTAKLQKSDEDLKQSQDSLNVAKSSYDKAQKNYTDTLTLLKDAIKDRDKWHNDYDGQVKITFICLIVIVALVAALALLYFLRRIIP